MHTRIESCPHVDREELVRLLRVELGQRMEGGREAPLQLQLRCDGRAAQVHLVARRGTTQLARRLPAQATTGEVGARVVALSMIELLRELEAVELPAPPPAPAPPPREAAHEPEPANRSLRFVLSGQALWPHTQPPLLGAVLSADMAPHGRRLLLRLDVGLVVAERTVGLAAVRSRLVHVAPQAGVWHRGRRWDGWTALGYRLGQARIAGDAGASTRPAAVQAALWGGPLLAAGAGIALYGPLSVQLGAELGLAVHTVTGEVEGAADVSLDAFWFSARLGVGYAL